MSGRGLCCKGEGGRQSNDSLVFSWLCDCFGGFSRQYSMYNSTDDHFPQHTLTQDTFCRSLKPLPKTPFLQRQSEEWAEGGAAIVPGKVPSPTSIPFNATKNIWMLSLCHDNNHKYSTFFFLCVSVSCLSLFRSLRCKTWKTFVFVASNRNWGQEWFNKSPHPCPVILQPAPTVLWGAILRAVFYGQFCTPSLPPP